MKQIENLQNHYQNLSPRDQKLAIITIALLIITLFYTMIWEPIHDESIHQKQEQKIQQDIYVWMKNAQIEVDSIRKSGNTTEKIAKENSPVSIVIEQSANTSGLKKYISKIESSGKNSAQIKIENASFDQMLLWINTLNTRYGIFVSSAKIERTDKEGIINARLTLKRN